MNMYIIHLMAWLSAFLGRGPDSPGTTSANAGERPNVIFIVADDLNRYAVLKDYPVLKTPALDKLMGESYNFVQASCAAPVCMPSRTAFFSGIYPHRSGVYLNKSPKSPNPWEATFLKDIETLPECFKRNGYITWGRGKSFHVEIGKAREARMFDNRPIVKGGYGPYSSPEKWHSGNHWSSIEPWEGPDSDFPDVNNAGAAIDFISQPHNKPFFLYLGLWRPHTPYTAPKRFFDLYDEKEMELPPGYLENDQDDIPPMGRALVDSMSKYRKEGMSREEVWLRLMKAYCANVSFADWSIGRVLEALDRSPHAKNTIVIVCSDNGFHNGTKQRWEKGTLWEQSDMVPLIIRLPGGGPKREGARMKLDDGPQQPRPEGGKGYRCTQTVGLIDIYPTLVEYCRLDPPQHQLDGQSLLPIFENPEAPWDRPGLTTYGEGYASLRTERHRYIRYPDGGQELYDHSRDPYELENLAERPEMQHVLKELSLLMPAKFRKSIGGRFEVNVME